MTNDGSESKNKKCFDEFEWMKINFDVVWVFAELSNSIHKVTPLPAAESKIITALPKMSPASVTHTV